MGTRLFRRIWYLLNRRRLERELEREMAAHRAEMGEPSRFGGTLRLREQSADAWGWRWLDELWQDLRYGLRQLRRTPVFTLVAALTLAVGIGANATAFGVVKAVLLADLPVPEPRALRQFAWDGAPRDFSEDTFRHLQANASGFSALTCVSARAATLGRGDRYEQAQVVWVSGAFARTFDAGVALGRPLTPADDVPGTPPVAVLSYESWQRKFGAHPSVVGSVMTLDDAPVTVVGIMRRGFTTSVGRRPPDLWLPTSGSLRTDAADGTPQGRSCRIIGRLSPGRAEELTRQEIELVLRRSGLPLPSARTGPRARGAVQLQLMPMGRGIDEMRAERPGALRDELPQIAGALFLLLAVLIVPCANVAAMLLARAMTRRPEIVARLALGASRRRLVRQLLTEGALLAALAGAAGVLMSGLFISNLGPPFALDLSVLAITATLCALATLSFALAPALTATRGDLASRVRESAAGPAGRVRGAPGATLVAVQVLVSCVLLAVAGLQVRTLLTSVRPVAAESERVLIFETNPGRGAPGGYVQDSLRHLHALPGVVSAAAASPDVRQVDLCEQGGRSTRQIAVWLRPVSPGYFATLRIPLERGRDMTWDDSRAGHGVVVINGALARAMFGSADPVGRALPIGECELVPVAIRNGVTEYGRRREVDDGFGLVEPLTVVGVVPDTFNGTDVDFSSGSGVSSTMYLPYDQVAARGGSSMTFAVRAALDATLLAAPARRAMQQAAPGAIVGAIQTQAEQLARRAGGVRLVTAVYVLLGLLALGQAAFGLYGTVSQFVNRRTSEIGLRLVLGARVADVIRLVVRQALTPVVIGLLLGLACGPIVARVMRAGRLIAEPGWADLLAVLAAVSVLMAMACAASSMPAWRVSRMDPATALREE